MSKDYKEKRLCPFCKMNTVQEITDSKHERDSSGDWQECTVCGGVYSGLTGKWSPGTKKKSKIGELLKENPKYDGGE